ncbi:cupin domain-containing protein [Scytonema hofmannii FACHB-248]|uniref:Cupin domain-containing protein n=1 Tax=Scytonema hofmannii FACHB-248 TaxID=1842502 RepID=A0ABR8GMX5_9CYAN|nr:MULTISPECIES: cupin domain-containing protein [Nostocales]MBD2604510.1 cupin domain-containing protein [Scytonema hofmannii FACHB-248]
MNLETFIKDIFSHNISPENFSLYVKNIWKSEEGCVMCYHDPGSFCLDIWHLSFDKLITEHGRHEQPLSISQHLFGDENHVSARLVYDPPPKQDNQAPLEYHSHPVDTVIVIVSGSGIFSFICNDSKQPIDIDLRPGKTLFFPSNTVHTIKEVGNEGLETLNITNRLNQPSYRTEPINDKKDLLVKPSEDFCQSYDPNFS